MAQDLLNALTLGSLYLLFALGMSLAWGTIGILNFAHGSIFMFSAFVAHEAVTRVPLPMWAMIGIGVAGGRDPLGAHPGAGLRADLKRAGAADPPELQILVGGIGIAIIPLSLAQHITESVLFGYSNGTFQVVTYDLGFMRVSNVQIVILVAALGLAGVIALVAALDPSGAGAAGHRGRPRGRLDHGRRPPPPGAAHDGRRRRTSPAWPACCSPTTWAPSPPRPVTASCSRRSPRSSSAVSAASPASWWARWSSPGSRPLVLVTTAGTWTPAIAFGLIFLMLLVRPRGLLGRQEVRRT